jgi:hypothetical protein
VLAAGITLVILTVSFNGRARRIAAEEQVEKMKAEKPSALSARETTPAPEDFLLPELQPAAKPPAYYPFRPRLEHWSEQVIGKYWIPPRDIAIDILGNVNDRNMDRLFEHVP